jgi:hypothetical protein
MKILALYGAIGVILSLLTLWVNWRQSGNRSFPLQATWLLPHTSGLAVAHRIWRRVGWFVLGWLILTHLV